MKLKFTRKTWYFLLLASAAASMLNGFAILSGTSFGLIEQIAFAAAGIAALFLAAEKGSASWEKRNFTGVFVLLMVSYMVNGWAGYLCSALAWPLLLSTEYKRGMAVQRQLQLVGAAEALHLFFLLMAKYGGMAALGFWTNLLWVLLACARGWAAYLFSALVWPALLALEYQKGRPIQRQLQLVGAAEAFHLLFVLLTVYGGMAGLSFWANLLWVLLACARGWAALSLYKMQEEDA